LGEDLKKKSNKEIDLQKLLAAAEAEISLLSKQLDGKETDMNELRSLNDDLDRKLSKCKNDLDG